MNLDETLDLLGQISLVDDRVVKVDHIEQRAQVTVWAAVLRDVPYAFAGEAVGRHYAESAYPIMPKDIAARWRNAVRDRLGRATGTFEPTDHPHLDPDDAGGYVRALRAERGAVAGGDSQPVGVAPRKRRSTRAATSRRGRPSGPCAARRAAPRPVGRAGRRTAAAR
jgi:hypothetical protein